MLGLLAFALLTAAPAPLTTLAERSGWKETGRGDEVVQLCHAFAKRYPKNVRCEQLGITSERRAMLALVASADGVLDPRTARVKHRPVVLIQSGLHADESDGKDAGFWLLRDILDGKALPGVLRKVTVLFVPVVDVDGLERIGPNPRPAAGPAETGARVTAQHLDLDRDGVKADAPETQALLRFLDRWDPLLLMDLHTRGGAQFQPDVAVLLEPNLAGPQPLRQVGRRAQLGVFDTLRKEGHQPLEFSPSFLRAGDPSSGFAQGLPSPRSALGYWPSRNRFAVRVETHAGKDDAARVKTTRDVVLAFLERAAEHGEAWLTAAKEADAADRKGPRTNVPLAWTHDAVQTAIDFPGYRYARKPSPISGELGITYDLTHPELWHVPFFPAVKASLSVNLPRAGYIVPAAQTKPVRALLELHGFRYVLLKKPVMLKVRAWRARGIHFDATSSEGRQRLTSEGAWRDETQSVPAGSVFVPSAQRGQRLLAQLFSPNAPDALLSWGFFNAFFEPKASLAPDVLEPWAEALLAKDATVKEAFEARLRDPAFAHDPKARLRFFAERHPAWDDRFGLYPVFQVDVTPR